MQLFQRIKQLFQKKTPEEIQQTQEYKQELRLWDKLSKGQCPKCQQKSDFYLLAEGGMARKIQCANEECKQKYWVTPERAFGAKYID